jgi:prophage endopeptidase
MKLGQRGAMSLPSFKTVAICLCAILFAQHYQEKVDALRLTQAQEVAAARAADVETLQLAKRHGDALTLQLQVAEASLTKKEKELHDAIASKTTGRLCLTGNVVRLLNDPAGDSVSTPTAVPAAENGPAASDTDVAQWANFARTQYDICRARLNALIDW